MESIPEDNKQDKIFKKYIKYLRATAKATDARADYLSEFKSFKDVQSLSIDSVEALQGSRIDTATNNGETKREDEPQKEEYETVQEAAFSFCTICGQKVPKAEYEEHMVTHEQPKKTGFIGRIKGSLGFVDDD